LINKLSIKYFVILQIGENVSKYKNISKRVPSYV